MLPLTLIQHHIDIVSVKFLMVFVLGENIVISHSLSSHDVDYIQRKCVQIK